MKKELNPTKRKTHKEIISNFEQKNKNVYCLVGLEHRHIMQKLDNDYLILKDVNSLVSIGNSKREAFKKQIKGKNIFFIDTSYNGFLSFLTDYNFYYKKDNDPYFIDIEVLKAYELIPQDELNLNDYQLSLGLTEGSTLKDYINEIEEYRHKPNEIYTYIKELINDEIKRKIEERKNNSKGRKNNERK